eukprot:TRINITY_DN3625_c0_g4_i4.p1 TRINITY_DN3625_c0_g4~~TRINITY_DN3625_c0_g4_i4.p1  ORF type:complete len:162 (+),score=22.39 TRINITY_DN3625_c0_g4_i4:247-732(+)
MQSDNTLPINQRRNYNNAFDGIYKIIKNETWTHLWRGCGPTVFRATLITSTQLPIYDTVKIYLNKVTSFRPELVTFISSLASAAASSLVTSPVDVVKTRMMKMKDGVYKSSLDCVLKTIKVEGVLGLYKGLFPTFLRLAPHNIILWQTMELVSSLLRKYKV